MDNKELIDYFIDQTNERFNKLEGKVDQVLQFKWQIIGGSVVVSTIFSVLIAVFFGR